MNQRRGSVPRSSVILFALLLLTAGMGSVPCLAKSRIGRQHASHSTPARRAAEAARAGVISKDPYLGAMIVDVDTGRILFTDHADARGYPASLVKLMDLLIILEKIDAHQLSLHDLVPVSARAVQASPSKVWLSEKETFTVDEMLYALMVHSANDAAVALAEKVGGSTDHFVELMNAKARVLGMSNTIFHSVNGLPPARGEAHDITTAHDLAILSLAVLRHPDTLRYTGTRVRTFRPNGGNKAVKMIAHNHLLGRVEGCDGLKTGYIRQAGFSIAVTAQRKGHRIIVIVLDSIDNNTRDRKATELVAKGFAALGEGSGPITAKNSR